MSKDVAIAADLLATNDVIDVVIRDKDGNTTDFSHHYPVGTDGTVKMPSIAPIQAAGLSLKQFEDAVRKAYEALIIDPSVSTRQSSSSVAYERKLDTGDDVHLRVLANNGEVEPISGKYFVNANGNVDFPVIGTVPAKGRTFAELEADVAQRAEQFFRDPVVHVTDTRLP